MSINSQDAPPYATASSQTAAEDSIIEQALAILNRRMREPGPSLLKSEDVFNHLILNMADLEHEVFGCIFLDTRHRVITLENLFRGTLNAASVYPRELLKRVLALNAGAVILYHNHPSGKTAPSTADKRITRVICEALKLIDVKVLDHIIVAGTDHLSFAKQGLL